LSQGRAHKRTDNFLITVEHVVVVARRGTSNIVFLLGGLVASREVLGLERDLEGVRLIVARELHRVSRRVAGRQRGALCGVVGEKV